MTEAAIRYGRQAAVSSNTPPANRPGSLPLGWFTQVAPEDVLLHVDIAGEPQPKQRPQHTRAKINAETGVLQQGHTYTPTRTVEAERLLRLVFNSARKTREPCPHQVGVLLFFKTRHGTADADNLAKLVLDAMNGTVLTDDQQVTELHVHLLRHCTDPGTDVLVWMTGRRTPGG